LPARTSARLGADFTKLWTASAVSNIGDGVTMAAGPLLVVSISSNPALIAGAVFAQQLPWLLFALISGAYADRLDRRRLVVTVNLLRALAMTVLALTILTSTVSVAVIYVVLFLLGTGETLVDTAMGALLPAVVAPQSLPRANARLYATFTIGNQFVAKPLGAWLFVVAAAAPFGFDAFTFVAAAALTAGIRTTSAPAARTPLGASIAEGVRWLWRHRLIPPSRSAWAWRTSRSAPRSPCSCSTAGNASGCPRSATGSCSPRSPSVASRGRPSRPSWTRCSEPAWCCVPGCSSKSPPTSPWQ
jgi:MFS family permease